MTPCPAPAGVSISTPHRNPASPFGELLSLRTAMDRIFDEPFFRPVLGTSEDAFAMPMDIRTTEDALVIEAALPGVRPRPPLLGCGNREKTSFCRKNCVAPVRRHPPAIQEVV